MDENTCVVDGKTYRAVDTAPIIVNFLWLGDRGYGCLVISEAAGTRSSSYSEDAAGPMACLAVLRDRAVADGWVL